MTEPRPSIATKYAHVIEFALVELRFRYGASIDEILLDPELGGQFEKAVKAHAPKISGRDARLGALYLRKSRNIPKSKRETVLTHFDVSKLKCKWDSFRRLSDVSADEIPNGPGLIEVREEERWLYVVGSPDVHVAMSSLTADDAFGIMSSPFWTPDPRHIFVNVAIETSPTEITVQDIERRLIFDHNPVFNWPIRHSAA